MTEIERIREAGSPGFCLGCATRLRKDAPGNQEWCGRKKCLRLRARLYAKDIRRPSTLVKVLELRVSDRRATLRLACDCVLHVPASRIRNAMHCKRHPEGLPQ